MRIILLVFLSILMSNVLVAQQDLTLYQFSGIPQNNLVNPSQMPDDKFVIGLPVLSSVNTIYNNRAYSINDGFDPETGILTIDPYKFVANLNENNFFNAQLQDQWFLFGMRLDKHYFKIGISEKVSFDFAYPKALFDFMLQGNANFLGERVDIGKLAFNATNYREISLGYATKLNDKWQIGGHLNLLFGLANIHTKNLSFGIYTDPESYDITIDGSIEVNTSGINTLQGNTLDYLQTGTNFGLGLDLGATFYPNEKWEVSTSLINVGFINWNNDLTTYTNDSKSFTLTGIDIIDFINGRELDGDSIISGIEDSINDVFSFDEVEKKYTSTLAPKWYVGSKYSINEKNNVYATMMLQFFPTGTRFGLSLGYELDLNKFIGFTANYSIYNNSFSNFGIGLRLRGGPIQLYVISDSMLASFDLFNYSSVHFRFGINILFGELQAKTPVKNDLL